MPLPRPLPGLVLRYSYLWHDEARRGLEEGAKDRPCVIVSAVDVREGDVVVTVAPVTHRSPRPPDGGVEIPPLTKQRLGLDDDRSWIVVNDLNRFHWPGPDLRPVPGRNDGSYAYGFLPPKLFKQVTKGIAACATARRVLATKR